MLIRLGLYTTAPVPEVEPIWMLMRSMQQLTGAPFSIIRGPHRAKPRAARVAPLKIAPAASVEVVPSPNAVVEEGESESDQEEPESLAHAGPAPAPPAITTVSAVIEARQEITSEAEDNLDVLEKYSVKALAKHIQCHAKMRRLEAAKTDRQYLELRDNNQRLRRQLTQQSNRLALADVERREFENLKVQFKSLAEGIAVNEPASEAITPHPMPFQDFILLTDKAKHEKLAYEHRKHLKTRNELRSTLEKVSNSQAETAAVRAQTGMARMEPAEIAELARSRIEITELHKKNSGLLTELVQRLETRVPAVRGRIGEDELFDLLENEAPTGCTISLTRHIPHHGDFMMVYRNKDARIQGYAIVDSKNYEGTVGTSQVGKLEIDIQECVKLYGVPPVWAAVISIESTISHNGCSRAPDYFTLQGTRMHLIHNLKEIGDDGTAGIRRLHCVGKLDVEAIERPSTILADEQRENCGIG